ncbi:hypothetical protein [Novosphingobium sp.]|uniref:hypothetical protein n=1 Tax=Novosphingobium sp. TaxID=1874826 RepID=UPI0026281B59|nr:hypothetical protein [Novosphingobium sp.]
MDLPFPNETAVPDEQAELTAPTADTPVPAPRAVVDVSTIDFDLPKKGGKGGEVVTPVSATPPSPPLPAPVHTEVQAPAASFVADGVFTPKPQTNLVIARLREQGWYRGLIGPGKHAVECPWAPDHQGQPDLVATYTEPTLNLPYGHFECVTEHAAEVSVRALLDRLDIEPQRARGKPVLRLEAGEQNLILAAAEHVLSTCENFYQAKGNIVRLRGAAGGDVATELASEQVVAVALSGGSDWEKYDGRSKTWVRCDPPARVCQMLVRASGYGSLPVLNGIARQPFFRKGDNGLVTQPGYDRASGIYAHFKAEDYRLPEPTRAAAEAALDRLSALIGEFHFAGGTDRAALLCALLTATVRPSLALAPAFNITAASPGSGKSYATRLALAFASTSDPLNMSYPARSEEASKAMLAALLQAPAAIAFDDMQTDWLPHGVINRMLTSETISERILGSSRVVMASTNCFIVGSGNNVGPVRDMCRRVVSIRLAPPSSSPATLVYKGRPVETMLANRESYIADALTIICAWQAAGAPKADVPPIGSFGEWSDLCRQPLLWMGLPDPASSLLEQLRNDPDAASLAAFMEAWSYEFGERPVQVRKLVQTIELHPDQALAEAVYDLPVMDRNSVNPGKLGWYLKKNAERIVDGHVIRQVITPERRAWTVAKVT